MHAKNIGQKGRNANETITMTYVRHLPHKNIENINTV